MSINGEWHIMPNVLFVKTLGTIYHFLLVDIITDTLTSKHFFLLYVNQLLANVKEQLHIAKFTSEKLESNFSLSELLRLSSFFFLKKG